MSSLPVPSRVALTALRGLVLGTSCSLAIIAEDRRRKINNAMRAVENGKKIKGAKRYHAGGGALAVAMEEEVLWDIGMMPMNQPENIKRREVEDGSNLACRESEIMARMHKACEKGDPEELKATMGIVLEAMKHKRAPNNKYHPWLKATALLCWHTLTTTPFTLIDLLLAQDEQSIGRDTYNKNLETAIDLFLATFTAPPTQPLDAQVYETGWKLLEAAFAAQRLHRIVTVYTRCHAVAADNAHELTAWFIANMREHHEYKQVVRAFLFTYAKSNPTYDSMMAIGATVVECVELAHSYRPKQVLQALHAIAAPHTYLQVPAVWTIKLLLAHWRQERDFQKTAELFKIVQQWEKPGQADGGIYRVMVEIAVQAGEEDAAESYMTAGLGKYDPDIYSHIRWHGLRARMDAARGDWEAVFVPVLKTYSESHTTRETEEFLREYVEELDVPLNSFTVTFMAKLYGAIRDADSLVAWLNYASQANFSVDAGFTNAILARCKRDWNFSFNDLRSLFRKIRALNTEFVDDHTERIMANAALGATKYGGKAAKGRLLSLRLDMDKLAVQGKCAPVEDVLLALREALTAKRPHQALTIYKRAMHLGLPFSSMALRLAVQARMSISDVNSTHHPPVSKMLRDAQAQGHDIAKASNYVLSRQLGDLAPGARGEEEVFDTVTRVLTNFQSSGVELTEASVHAAAIACLQAGHFRAAVSLALRAATMVDDPTVTTPCYCFLNFKILLGGYAGLVDLVGLRDTIERGLATRFKEKEEFRSTLRFARLAVKNAEGRTVLEQNKVAARAMLDEAIERTVEARRDLRVEGKFIESEAVRIMRQAALDQGCRPVDFNDVPWLQEGRKWKAKGGEGEEAETEERKMEERNMEETKSEGTKKEESIWKGLPQMDKAMPSKLKKDRVLAKSRRGRGREPDREMDGDDPFNTLDQHLKTQQEMAKKAPVEASF
ncbi:hypothetical protein N0V88_003078 [Collariella sp. IMI 366227]|nr:hypothetical protein N0V88_003078 [Collariella sp. IMI 366227]